MLKGIPRIISPELLKILCEMGHGDTLVIADGNFPAASLSSKLITLSGHGSIAVLEAILELFPLDEAPITQIGVMETADQSKPEIWEAYAKHATELVPIERYAFYEKAKNAYCIIATSESALYANAILTKGVL
ncbi:RbsD/FucU domain-containing protein [Fusibacter bizertensis]|jgi:Fucose dissimilation pathway protein FucU|uniref:RbsD/FucU domain-containing protein n=1 Tax=Fusibacter bizertensis TaxID=1488331 RepID=A0ABT6NAA1_9FIRM|nr:RbsD/FucU domain-containing protein [Fusibacter bizertensis]MDH8677342.1 RbsD/FucU domain-containing protein [Fusibacter bizertensis]